MVTFITSIIDLTRRKEREILQEHELGSTIAEITVETLFRILAIILSLLMVKYIRALHRRHISTDDSETGSKGEYEMVTPKSRSNSKSEELNEHEIMEEENEEDDEDDDEGKLENEK